MFDSYKGTRRQEKRYDRKIITDAGRTPFTYRVGCHDSFRRHVSSCLCDESGDAWFKQTLHGKNRLYTGVAVALPPLQVMIGLLRMSTPATMLLNVGF